MTRIPDGEDHGPWRRARRIPRRQIAWLLMGAGTCAVALAGAGPEGMAGDPEAGRALFADKACARCHVPGSSAARGNGPALERLRRPQGEMELAGRLWNHVPGMFATLAEERVPWPTISAAEMADLMAYLLADASRDPRPDAAKGELVLMRKGCLKCHGLAHEGGKVEPDLAAPRADYESAAVWAAAMWTHSPAMAAMAARQGIAYPRFADDEMGNLVGFLKQAAATRRPVPAAR